MPWINGKLDALRSKIAGERKSAEFIARGWALGTFIGSVIPFGMQIYIALPLSFLLKGSKIGAVTGTLISNPVTIIFLYPAQCWLGSRLLGKDVSWITICDALQGVIVNQDWASLSRLSGHLVASFFAGGLVVAAVATPAVYFFVLSAVRSYRKVRGIEQVDEKFSAPVAKAAE